MEPIATRRAQILDATEEFSSGTSETEMAAARGRASRVTRKAKRSARREDIAAAVNAKLAPETVATLEGLAGRSLEARVPRGMHPSISRIAALTAAVIAATPESRPNLNRFGIAAAVCRAGRYAFHSRTALSEGSSIAIRQSDQPYPWCVSRLDSLASTSVGPPKFSAEELAQATKDVSEAGIDFERITWGCHVSAKKPSAANSSRARSTIADYLRPTRGGRPMVPPTIELADNDATHAETTKANIACREIARVRGLLDGANHPAQLARLLGDKLTGVPEFVPVGARLLLTSRDGPDRAGKAYGVDCVDDVVTLSELGPGWKATGSGTCAIPKSLLPANGNFLLFENVIQNVAAGDRLTPLTRHRVTLENGHRKSVYPHRSYVVNAIDEDIVTLAGVGRVCRADLPRWTYGWCMRPGIDARGTRSTTNVELHCELDLIRKRLKARQPAPEFADTAAPIIEEPARPGVCEPSHVEPPLVSAHATGQEDIAILPLVEATAQSPSRTTDAETSTVIEGQTVPPGLTYEIDSGGAGAESHAAKMHATAQQNSELDTSIPPDPPRVELPASASINHNTDTHAKEPDIEEEAWRILAAELPTTKAHRPVVTLSREDLVVMFLDVRHPDFATINPSPQMGATTSRYRNLGSHAFAYFLSHVRDRGELDPANAMYALWDLGIAFGCRDVQRPGGVPLGTTSRNELLAGIDADIPSLPIGGTVEVN